MTDWSPWASLFNRAVTSEADVSIGNWAEMRTFVSLSLFDRGFTRVFCIPSWLPLREADFCLRFSTRQTGLDKRHGSPEYLQRAPMIELSQAPRVRRSGS